MARFAPHLIGHLIHHLIRGRPVLASAPAPVLALIVTLGAAPAAAQDDGGGVQYRLGVSQDLRLQSRTSGTEASARTGLSFGYVTETRTQRLGFGASGALEIGPGRRSRILSDPSLSLDYRRDSPRARLELEAFLNRQRLDRTELIVDLDDAGDLIFETLATTARRERVGGRARLEFGRDAPFGGTFSLGETRTRFSGTASPDLVDNRRRNAGLDLRFDLSPVMRVTTGLDVAQFRETGAAQRQTETLSLGVAIDRPDGEYALDASLARRPEATRHSLVLRRQITLPESRLALRFGLSGVQGGHTRIIGGVDWQRNLPEGAITLGLERGFRGDIRDRETETTRLTVSGRQTFTPVLSGSASLGLQETRRLDDGSRGQGGDLSVSLRYALTPDWGLSAGASHSLRRSDGADDQRTTSVFLTLDREFLARR